jgi:hypothetical protein
MTGQVRAILLEWMMEVASEFYLKSKLYLKTIDTRLINLLFPT